MPGTMPSRPTELPFDTLVIVGIGLIGGSIALAAKQRRLARCVIGIGRDPSRLAAARDAGVLDQFRSDLTDLEGPALVVVCTPVDRIAEYVGQAAVLRDGILITDAGSVKECICRQFRDMRLPPGSGLFVGAHPLAGSEKTGWENGRADLFVDRLCVLTPEEHTPPEAVELVDRFWQSLGMRTMRMSPSEHDRAVAATSHVPHLAAAAVASLLDESNESLAATGFRDVTRVAGGDPELWTAIVKGNRTAVISALDRLMEHLTEYRNALDSANFEAITHLLASAKEQRDRLQF
jgi:prephenate dehydrogenase